MILRELFLKMFYLNDNSRYTNVEEKRLFRHTN